MNAKTIQTQILFTLERAPEPVLTTRNLVDVIMGGNAKAGQAEYQRVYRELTALVEIGAVDTVKITDPKGQIWWSPKRLVRQQFTLPLIDDLPF